MNGHPSPDAAPWCAAPALGRERGESIARFAQPQRFNWRTYQTVRQVLSHKITALGLWVTLAAVITLIWKSASGESISTARWLLGAGAGVFTVGMMHLGLFVLLSAPRCLRVQQGRIHLSGLGLVHPAQILQCSVRHEKKRRRQAPFVHVELCCDWHGWQRRWSLALEEGKEAQQLEQMLREALNSSRSQAREDDVPGIRTVVAGVPRLGLSPLR